MIEANKFSTVIILWSNWPSGGTREKASVRLDHAKRRGHRWRRWRLVAFCGLNRLARKNCREEIVPARLKSIGPTCAARLGAIVQIFETEVFGHCVLQLSEPFLKAERSNLPPLPSQGPPSILRPIPGSSHPCSSLPFGLCHSSL